MSTVARAKKGIRDYLKVTAGLTAADGVTIRSAPILPEEYAAQLVVLGDVAAPQAQAGIERRQETATMTCWVVVTKPGGDETAVDLARDRGDAILALVVGALVADKTAAGAVPAGSQVAVSLSGLEESPADWDGVAARRAQFGFSLSWSAVL